MTNGDIVKNQIRQRDLDESREKERLLEVANAEAKVTYSSRLKPKVAAFVESERKRRGLNKSNAQNDLLEELMEIKKDNTVEQNKPEIKSTDITGTKIAQILRNARGDAPEIKKVKKLNEINAEPTIEDEYKHNKLKQKDEDREMLKKVYSKLCEGPDCIEQRLNRLEYKECPGCHEHTLRQGKDTKCKNCGMEVEWK